MILIWCSNIKRSHKIKDIGVMKTIFWKLHNAWDICCHIKFDMLLVCLSLTFCQNRLHFCSSLKLKDIYLNLMEIFNNFFYDHQKKSTDDLYITLGTSVTTRIKHSIYPWKIIFLKSFWGNVIGFDKGNHPT